MNEKKTENKKFHAGKLLEIFNDYVDLTEKYKDEGVVLVGLYLSACMGKMLSDTAPSRGDAIRLMLDGFEFGEK